MRPIESFAKYMVSTVTVEPRTANDAYGKPTYGAAVTYRAHLAKGTRINLTSAGQEIVDSVEVHLMSADAVLPSARLTLSTADMGSTESFDRQPRILGVERRFSATGPAFVTIYAGWAPRSV